MRALCIRIMALAAACVVTVRATLVWARRTGPQVAQSMVEYAIIAAIVAVVAVGAVKLLGDRVNAAFTRAETSIDQAGAP
jgi:Flp pilus assembly pilin Flp